MSRSSWGNHPDVDIPKLKGIGVKGIFLPGTPMQRLSSSSTRTPGPQRDGCVKGDLSRSKLKSEVPKLIADKPTVTHTLLLADDSVTIQRVIELTFADEDVQVVAVSDGDQAIARLESALPGHRPRRHRDAGQERLRGGECTSSSRPSLAYPGGPADEARLARGWTGECGRKSGVDGVLPPSPSNRSSSSAGSKEPGWRPSVTAKIARRLR